MGGPVGPWRMLIEEWMPMLVFFRHRIIRVYCTEHAPHARKAGQLKDAPHSFFWPLTLFGRLCPRLQLPIWFLDGKLSGRCDSVFWYACIMLDFTGEHFAIGLP